MIYKNDSLVCFSFETFSFIPTIKVLKLIRFYYVVQLKKVEGIELTADYDTIAQIDIVRLENNINN